MMTAGEDDVSFSRMTSNPPSGALLTMQVRRTLAKHNTLAVAFGA